VDLYSSNFFSQKIQQFLKTTAGLNPNVSINLSMAATHSQPYSSALKWTSEMLQFETLNDISWNTESMHTVNGNVKCVTDGGVFVFDWSIQY
jgi:hypothetical protein